jgi:hypothetical protein
MGENIDIFHSNMCRLPSYKELQGHDTDENILKSRMLLWENSGRGNFPHLQNILINAGNKYGSEKFSDVVNITEMEISVEKVTKADASRRIKQFNKRMSNKSKLLACGCCGEKKFNSDYKEVVIEFELDILKLNNNQIEERNTLGEYKEIASVCKINDELYYIHPECITCRNGIHYTSMCGTKV